MCAQDNSSNVAQWSQKIGYSCILLFLWEVSIQIHTNKWLFSTYIKKKIMAFILSQINFWNKARDCMQFLLNSAESMEDWKKTYKFLFEWNCMKGNNSGCCKRSRVFRTDPSEILVCFSFVCCIVAFSLTSLVKYLYSSGCNILNFLQKSCEENLKNQNKILSETQKI